MVRAASRYRLGSVKGSSTLFEEFEREAVAKLLEFNGLGTQVAERTRLTALVTERTFTGVGFLTSFAVDPTLILDAGPPDQIVADMGALLNSAIRAGMMLKIETGRVTLLEGYTFGSDRWPNELHDYAIYRDVVRQV